MNGALQVLHKGSSCNLAAASSCQVASGGRSSDFLQERLKIQTFIVINQFLNNGLNLLLKVCVGQSKDPGLLCNLRSKTFPFNTHTHVYTYVSTYTYMHMCVYICTPIWITYIYAHAYILWGQGTDTHSGWLHTGCKR